MLKTVPPRIFIMYAAFAIALASTPVLSAQESEAVKLKQAVLPQAPVPAQIIAAKKIFISNAESEDALFPGMFSGGPDRPYNQFYAAMKTWGRYELVSAPAEADLVFEIRFVAPIGAVSVTNGSGGSSHDPQFKLAILDTKTHFSLWSLTEHVHSAFLHSTHDKNFDQALTNLVDDVKVLNGQPVVHTKPSEADSDATPMDTQP